MANPLGGVRREILSYSGFDEMEKLADSHHPYLHNDGRLNDCVVRVYTDEEQETRFTFSTSTSNAAYSPFSRTDQDKAANKAARREMLKTICDYFGFIEVKCERDNLRTLASQIKDKLIGKHFSDAQIKNFNFGDFNDDGKPLTFRRVKVIMNTMSRWKAQTNANSQGSGGSSDLLIKPKKSGNGPFKNPSIQDELTEVTATNEGAWKNACKKAREDLQRKCDEAERKYWGSFTGNMKIAVTYVAQGLGYSKFVQDFRSLYFDDAAFTSMKNELRLENTCGKVIAVKLVYDAIKPIRNLPCKNESTGKVTTLMESFRNHFFSGTFNLPVTEEKMEVQTLEDIIKKYKADD